MVPKKRKVDWINSKSKYLKQLGISFLSFITLPFFRQKDGATKKFFYNNYNKKKDEYIWDSNTSNYLNQISSNLLDKESLNNKKILDIGCGTGCLYDWLKNNKVNNINYTGIDFAIKSSKKGNNVRFLNSDINHFIYDEYELFFMINVLCYLSDLEIKSLISKLPSKAKLFIVEPYPNIFWDAHFNNIKPFYRKTKIMLSFLEKNGLLIESYSVDYLYKMGKSYLNKLSYCIIATKK